MTIDATLNKRLRRVVRKHDRMQKNGVVHRVGRDGLIRSRARLFRPQFPFKSLFVLVAVLVVFKALLFAQMGAGNYAAQVSELRAGNAVERVGAYVMQEEPITAGLGGFLKQFFFNS